MNNSDIAGDMAALDAKLSAIDYPEGFTEKYDILECLADRKDRETFLVRRKAAEGESAPTESALAVAKCYARRLYDFSSESDALESLSHPGLPKFLERFRNESYAVVVREYIEGEPLSEIVKERALSQSEITQLAIKLSDIFIYLHEREKPVIHRDLKPENVIIGEDGDVRLIDFDIARVFKPESESDTLFFGTKGYAPPEQYGFKQTDARADIYSFGVLLRFLLTGSVRENPNITLYRPLGRIISKCTAFAPEKRFKDMRAVKKALEEANPRTQFWRKAFITLVSLAGALLICAAGIKLYKAVTYTPFTDDVVPAFVSDEERVEDAVLYMSEKYDTELFLEPDDTATVGLLRQALIELYGLDSDYVYGINTDIPRESPDFFLPWGWDDGQTIDRDIAIYAAVKLHDPALVADWSTLKDDNGFYPGVRVALAFSEETGLSSGMSRPKDISKGELALALANADRLFEAAEESR